MRISDWSSDVCSSDLLPRLRRDLGHPAAAGGAVAHHHGPRPGVAVDPHRRQPADQLPDAALRLLAVLPARRRPEGGHHRTDLCRGRALHRAADLDRQSVVEGKSVSVRLDIGGSRILKKKKDSTKIKQSSLYEVNE